MKMEETRRGLLLLLVVAWELLLGTSSVAGVSLSFKLIFKGGQMITATYTSFPRRSNIVCAGLCISRPGCWVYTWNYISLECQLLDQLTDTIYITSATSSLNTYYVERVNGHTKYLTQEKYNWQEGKVACEALGGRLALPPDTTYALLLHHLLQEDSFYVGMWRVDHHQHVWYNMGGQVATRHPQWAPVEPDNRPDEIVIFLKAGYMKDGFWTYKWKVLCEI